MRTVTLQSRIDKETKTKAQNILSQLNMTLSEAIVVYLKQIIYHRGIPFEIKIPNTATEKVLKAVKTGRGLHKVSGAKALFKELNR